MVRQLPYAPCMVQTPCLMEADSQPETRQLTPLDTPSPLTAMVALTMVWVGGADIGGGGTGGEVKIRATANI
jgi:hypothetical protein